MKQKMQLEIILLTFLISRTIYVEKTFVIFVK